MSSPILWYANRGTGVVLLVLFTVTTVLGILSTGRGTSRLWPRFVTQGVHRSIALVSSVMLVVHILTAVIDQYVDIRWWQSLLPFSGTYRPLYLGFGSVALDLTIAVVATSLLRHRLPVRAWRSVHLFSYAAWLFSVLHTIGIGTDVSIPWFRDILVGSIGLVAVAVVVRVVAASRRSATSTDPLPAAPVPAGRPLAGQRTGGRA